MAKRWVLSCSFFLCTSCGLFGPSSTAAMKKVTVACRFPEILFNSKTGSCEETAPDFLTGAKKTDKRALPTIQQCRLTEGEFIAAGNNECILAPYRILYDPGTSKAILFKDGKQLSGVDCTSREDGNSNLGATSGQSCEDVY